MARRTRRGKSYRVFWTKPRVRWAVVFGFIVWVAAALSVPPTTYGQLLGMQQVKTSGTYSLGITGLPAVKYSANISYSADGLFSVGAGNPISMHAVVYDVNVSDFTSYFNGVGLLYQDVPIAMGGGGSVALFPQFHSAGLGKWAVDAKVVFAKPINFTGPVLSLVNPPANVSSARINDEVTSQVKAYAYPFPPLQPQSYTDQLAAKESYLRYGAAASALVLVLLLPVFYRRLLPSEGREGSEK